jgi:hypothetical protein
MQKPDFHESIARIRRQSPAMAIFACIKVSETTMELFCPLCVAKHWHPLAKDSFVPQIQTPGCRPGHRYAGYLGYCSEGYSPCYYAYWDGTERKN